MLETFYTFLEIISITNKNKVIHFLKCTRTLWTPEQRQKKFLTEFRTKNPRNYILTANN